MAIFTSRNVVSAEETKEITEEELQIELMESVDSETLGAMENLDEYLIIDSNGVETFDIISATKNDESDLLIAIGSTYNQFGNDYINIEEEAITTLGWPKISLYGNFCGPAGKNGSNFSKKAIDDLDSACKAHDRCYKPGKSDKTTNRSCNLAFMKRLLPVIQKSSKLSKKHIVAVAAYKYFANRL